MAELTASDTLVSPEATSRAPAPANPIAPNGPQPPRAARAPRCRMLDKWLNRCGGEELGGTGLCGHHLGLAAADFRAIVETAGVAAVLRGGDD